ncbi:MAG TPA: hypothetical protein VFP78_14010 [Solirubrobacteraceae bacterium]|nr:hypothetical protein [Solirubrobacteraceae bacterium]
MRAALAILALALVPAAPASAATVDAMVVGKERTLRGPKEVRLKQRTVKVSGRRCRVGARTPLSVLAATRLRLGIRDYARCGRDPRDAGGLYVAKVGREREKGRGGWVYKVGRRAGTAGAADPAGSFGTGRRLRHGQRVTWFWCELQASGGCQRTLEARPERRTARPGEALRVTVRGYDDFGRGVAAAGAAVRLGSAAATTDAQGVAVLTLGPEAGRLRLTATRAGLVRAFPMTVTVG